jgi:hypothetical protein
MAFGYAHGAIQWLSADAATTVYAVSGLSFQPKLIKFTTLGLGSATDASSTSVSERANVGFAVSTSDRRCVAAYDRDTGSIEGTALAMVCTTAYRTDAVAVTLTTTPTVDGSLDINSITSDGFTLIVDDATPINITVFWEAWGGSDITVAALGEIAEPAAIGTQDYTVTGFVAGDNGDQVVMIAGCQFTGAANATPARNDSGLCIGAATGGTAGENIVIVANNDDASANADTDKYARSGECLAMITVAGGNPNARAQLTQFGTNNFRLDWLARGVTSRKYIFAAIKGGQWRVGGTTIDATTANATATVASLPFAPVGLSLISCDTAEDAAGTATAYASLMYGVGSSTSSRRAMTYASADGSAAGDIFHWLEYDQVLRGGVAFYDISQMNADGFQLIVDTADAGGNTAAWIGYLTFAGSPAAVPFVPSFWPVRVVLPPTPRTVVAAPPSTTASAQQGVTWWPRAPDWRPVQRALIQSVLAVPLFVTPAVTPADGVSTTTGAYVRPVDVRQYTPIAGVVGSGTAVGWIPQIDTLPTQAAALIRSVQAVPFNASLSPPSVEWWTPGPPARPQVVNTPDSVVAYPTIVTTTAQQGVTWTPVHAPAVRAKTAAPSVAVVPLGVSVVVVPDRPLLLPNEVVTRSGGVTHHLAIGGPVAVPLEVGWWTSPPRLVLARDLPQLSVLSAPVRDPSAVAQVSGWWPQLGRFVLPLAPVRHGVLAEPVTKLGIDARSDLPWHPRFVALERAPRVVLSELVVPVRLPDPPGVTFGWWPREAVPVVLRLVDVKGLKAIPIQPLNAAGRSDLPWIPDFPALQRAPRLWPSTYAVPVRLPDPAGVTFGWWPQAPSLVLARIAPLGVQRVRAPLVSEGSWNVQRPQPLMMVRDRAARPIFAQPLRVDEGIAWMTRPSGLVVPVRVLVPSRVTQPVTKLGVDGRSDLPWIPEFPALQWPRRVRLSQIVYPLRDPAQLAVPAVIVLPWGEAFVVLPWSDVDPDLPWGEAVIILPWRFNG